MVKGAGYFGDEHYPSAEREYPPMLRPEIWGPKRFARSPLSLRRPSLLERTSDLRW